MQFYFLFLAQPLPLTVQAINSYLYGIIGKSYGTNFAALIMDGSLAGDRQKIRGQ